MKNAREYGLMWLSSVLLLAAVATPLTLTATAYAQGGEARGDLLEAWRLWRDIEVLQMCNEIGLTSQQAVQAAAAINGPATELDAIRATEASPQMQAVLHKIRTVLLKGQPIGENLWLEVATVGGRLQNDEEEGDALERRKAELAHEIATALAAVLTPAQLAKLTVSPPEQVAREVTERLTEARARPPNEWDEFKAGAKTEITQAFGDTPLREGNALTDDIDAFLERVRKMDTDLFFQSRGKLADELAAMVTAAQDVGPEAGRMRALDRLSGWAEAPGLLQLLNDMAVAERSFPPAE